jgi:glycosyltransferase involved in cell wall biosynthesis
MSESKILTALPVYNEVQHLKPVLAEVRKYCDRILVVDDGSNDGTSELLDAEDNLWVIHHERNLGYGAGLRSAFEFAQCEGYDALVTIDCDGQHQPCLIPHLARALDEPDAVDIVSGSRYLQSFAGDSTPPESRKAINMQINELLAEELGLHVTDSFCGFKAYRVSALSSLEVTEAGYAMPMQFWVQVVARGLSVREFPVPLIYLEEERSFGGSLDNSEKRMQYYLSVFERERDRWESELADASPRVGAPAEAPAGCSL